MERFLNCVAGAAQRGPSDPEWNYLEAEEIPMLEVKGYKCARFLQRVKGGDRQLETIALDLKLSDHEVDMIVSLLSKLEATQPFPRVSLFSGAVAIAIEKEKMGDLKKWLDLGFPVSMPLPCFDSAAATRSITALHYAVDQKNEEAVGLLLEYGASPLALDSNGKSPLSFALGAGSLEFAETMLAGLGRNNEGARALEKCLCHISNDGIHPMLYVFGRNALRVIKLLARRKVRVAHGLPADSREQTALHSHVSRCIEGGDVASLRDVFTIGWSPDELLTNLTPKLTPAIVFAVHKSQYDMVEFLCKEAKADPNVTSQDGNSARKSQSVSMIGSSTNRCLSPCNSLSTSYMYPRVDC
jgi:hypothetical protein